LKYTNKKVINNKNVYIVESHHHVLETWFLYKELKPFIISLDHHSDSIPAYLRHAHNSFSEKTNRDIKNKFQNELIKKYTGCKDIHTVWEAIKLLRNDEFHDAALFLGLINKSFIINYMRGCGNINPRIFNVKRGNRYKKQKKFSDESIIEIQINNSKYCINDNRYCNGSCHSTNCICYNFNLCIDNKVLDNCLSLIKTNIHLNWENNYILDIDLDYFHTFASIDHLKANNFHTLEKGVISDIPLNLNLNTFYSLIRNAKAITIAKEKTCVDMWNTWEYSSNLNADSLLDKLLTHIKVATSN
jgi:hypothetical protein